MSRRNKNQARVKIQSPTEELAEEIVVVLEENFLTTSSKIMDSDRGGYHVIVDLRSLGVRE